MRRELNQVAHTELPAEQQTDNKQASKKVIYEQLVVAMTCRSYHEKPGGRAVIYPLVGFDNEPYSNLTELVNTLADAGASVSLRNTDFRFLPAADRFLQMIKPT